MNKHTYIKKIFATISAAAIAVTALSSSIPSISAVDTNIYAAQGTWGTDGKWVLSEDGTLTVTGTGELGASALTPKFNFVQDVKRLVVGEGITKIDNGFTGSGDLQHANVTEMVLPSTLSGYFGFSIKGKAMKDAYIYSKDISFKKENSGMLPKPGSGVVMHLYKDSDTEKNFRNLYDYTDEDIVYIEGDRPEEPDPIPADIAELTEISGPSGLSSKWEWNETSKTITFSGTGVISIANEYKNYAEETEHIIIESGITSIFAYTGVLLDEAISGAFYNFTALKDVKLPDTLREIKKLSFYGAALTNINLPEGLIEIDDAAFKNCTNLEDITSFPESLNKIGDSAFQYCSKLKSINLHEGMTIGGRAFVGCESLKELTIPKNVKFLRSVYDAQGMSREPATFWGCKGLEKIVIEDGCWLGDSFGNEFTKNGIADQLCLQCYSLKTVVIKGDVDCIRLSAFGSCTSLTDIYLYNTGLTTITAKGTTNLANGGNPNVPDEWRDSFWTGNNPTFHVVKGSTTEQTLRDAGYLNDNNTKYLPDITTLETVIADAEKIDTTKYTNATLVNNLKTAIENAKSVRDNLDATQEDVDAAVKALNDAIYALTKPNTSVKPSLNPTPSASTTRSPQVVQKDKTTAENLMKQAKITKLTVKSKSKKKINVSWKKVKTAVGYQVQVSKKSNFKKRILNKFTTKKKFTITKKIKSGKTYFVRVRAYATYKDAFGNPQKVYSKWNKKLRKVKVK